MKRILALVIVLVMPAPILAGEDRFGLAFSLGATRSDTEAIWSQSTFSDTAWRAAVHGRFASWLGAEIGHASLGSETVAEFQPGICAGSVCTPPSWRDVDFSGSVQWFAFTPGWRSGPVELVAKLGYSKVTRKRADLPWATQRDSGALIGVGFARFGEGPWGFRLDYEKHDVASVFGVSATYRL